ncbi:MULTISPECIES: 16S rRNA (cytidine(1402)-2'-O)-methyltransferase [unclassified Herbaspirillum]|uniref:16S rRNA (cytidine(1402)-2'-O)-methyltransferase n=1 Tax=unclassified Herbaspirillum TaxID=2624150 RepID=UPI00383BE72E
MSHPNSSAAAASSVLSEAAQQTYPESALYVLATPIGNVCDVTLRALHVLAIADAVACEDTRNTSHLLTRYGISQTLIAAHEHNEREAAEKIIARLQQGQRIALVSDAGTPAVSDPGARIVEAVRAAGLRVVPLPGASAAVTALSASGLVNDAFRFVGFLPNKSKQREHALQKLAGDTATLVFYEAPHRIVETIDALRLAFGPERHVVLGRELTKLFETVHRCPLAEAPAWLAEDANRQRGEFVVLVEGAPAAGDDNDAEAERVLRILLEELPLKQAAGLAAQITGQKKNALYERALQIKDAGEAST